MANNKAHIAFDFDGVLGCMLDTDIIISQYIHCDPEYHVEDVDTGDKHYNLMVAHSMLVLLASLSGHHIHVLSNAKTTYVMAAISKIEKMVKRELDVDFRFYRVVSTRGEDKKGLVEALRLPAQVIIMVDNDRKAIEPYYLNNLIHVPTFGPKAYAIHHGNTTEGVSGIMASMVYHGLLGYYTSYHQVTDACACYLDLCYSGRTSSTSLRRWRAWVSSSKRLLLHFLLAMNVRGGLGE